MDEDPFKYIRERTVPRLLASLVDENRVESAA